MVFNATFNNISAISWQSVLLMKETGRPGENHQPVASHWQTVSHNRPDGDLNSQHQWWETTQLHSHKNCSVVLWYGSVVVVRL